MGTTFANSGTMVGNDADEHGCIVSAGYTWNETSQKCERPWEAKVYTNSADFLKAEGMTCKRATDGCNSVSLVNGQLGAMTQMYCEDVYGTNGSEKWSCLDQKLEDETLGFMPENDRNYYKTLQSQIDSKTNDRISGVLDTYGNKVLERYSWNVPKSVKLMEKTIAAFETAIHNLSMKTPADAAMNETDTKKYQILNFAKFELQIMMHRWMRNAGIN